MIQVWTYDSTYDSKFVPHYSSFKQAYLLAFIVKRAFEILQKALGESYY